MEGKFTDHIVDRDFLDIELVKIKDYVSLTDVLFDDTIQIVRSRNTEIIGSNMVSLSKPDSRVLLARKTKDLPDIRFVQIWRIPNSPIM